ncbi:hypothetical protein BBAD15_g6654 [Beauveria bassiana D1-5]|uniref:Uncharacterized protein n=1 Tax=Beauveria bassiana D1-5 TaxID=1245745 RepID=A0A0A2VJK9_BEABA|nr:hypothetical protein BBAD15_g6654 [Beauveria bassiana D1-5]
MVGSTLWTAPYRNLMSKAVRAPPTSNAFGIQNTNNNNNDPCAMISKAFEAMRNETSEEPIVLDLRPSVGTACLKSVPVAKNRNIDLINYLQPYIEYQSTIEILKNPPEEYLLEGVDLMGGLQAMKQKLKRDEYETQFDVMTDLQSLFVATNDNHFGYTPGLLSAFRTVRDGLDLVSVSKDGRELPEVYAAQDIFTPGNVTYTASPIETIDGQDVYEFLENEALRVPQGLQDPDAKMNSLFGSAPQNAAQAGADAVLSVFDVPDNYTIVHKNGTERVVDNSIITLPTTDLCGIRNGQDFRERFEVPPNRGPPPPPPPPEQENPDDPKNKEPPPPPPPPPTPALPGYPLPLAKHSNDMVASYTLNDTALRDTTVISFLSFVPLNVPDPTSPDFDLNSFVREFGDVVDRTASAAQSQGRDKLIIDMSANGGGSLDLADFAYTTFFPGAPFDDFDRYRLNGGLELTGKALSFNESVELLVGSEGLPLAPDNSTVEEPDAFFETRPVKGQKMTAPFHRDPTARYFDNPDVFLRGYEPGENRTARQPPWEPENMVILTDGTCASACTIFTGLMVRNFGIRTIALGGRPLNKPMQAIGGVKGSQVLQNAENKDLITGLVKGAQRDRTGRRIIKDVQRTIPDIGDPPILPFLEDPANGGSVNVRNAYSGDDPNGFPLHFKYEAANCRLFYTREMVLDVAESWRQAANIAFRNGTCVSGSTAIPDGRMSSQAPPFDPSVRGQAKGIPRPTLQRGN